MEMGGGYMWHIPLAVRCYCWSMGTMFGINKIIKVWLGLHVVLNTDVHTPCMPFVLLYFGVWLGRASGNGVGAVGEHAVHSPKNMLGSVTSFANMPTFMIM